MFIIALSSPMVQSFQFPSNKSRNYSCKFKSSSLLGNENPSCYHIIGIFNLEFNILHTIKYQRQQFQCTCQFHREKSEILNYEFKNNTQNEISRALHQNIDSMVLLFLPVILTVIPGGLETSDGRGSAEM